MSEGSRGSSFWVELKRRHVYKVAAVYAAVAVGVWQVADILVPALGLPDLIMKLVVIGPIITFPFAMVLAWAYDVTPEGVRATLPADDSTGAGSGTGDSAVAADRAAEIERLTREIRGRVVRRTAVGTLAAVMLVAGGWWGLGRIGPKAPELSEISLAVFPFKVGTETLEYLRDGIADLLSRNLAGASDLQPVDPSLMKKSMGDADPEGASQAGLIARRVGAGQFVTGAVSSLSNQVRIDASLYEVGDSVSLLGTRSVQGDTTELFDLVDQLTAGLLSELRTGAASERIVRTAATTTSSLSALKAYLEGEQKYRLGEHADATEAFQRAIAEDSAFALARYRLAMTFHMRGRHDAARREIGDALRHADGLAPHDRDLMTAFDAFHSGSITDAERQLRLIVQEYPRDLEARVILAELLMYYSPARARDLDEARHLLENVLEADPKFMCIYCQLSGALQAAGDIDGAERLNRLLAGEETGDTTTLPPQGRFAFGGMRRDTAAMLEALAELDTISEDAAYSHNVTLHMGTDAIAWGQFGVVADILRRSELRPETEQDRAYLQASQAIARGQWQEARRQFEIARRQPGPEPPIDWEVYSEVLNMPFEMQPYRLQELRQSLVDWTEGRTRATPADRDWPERLQPATRFYLLGLVASRLGDAAAARVYADSLTRLAADSTGDVRVIDGLARVVRADVHMRANEPEAALRELDAVSIDVPPSHRAPWISGLWYAKKVRVPAYMATGEPERAYQWLRYGIAPFGQPEAEIYGVFNRDMAYALDGMGRTEEAALYYARFVEAWENADPELQPQVQAARDRLTVLTRENR